MNKYLVTIKIRGQLVKTAIEAESSIHAKLLGEWHYGMGSVTQPPIKLSETAPKGPLTPEQARIKSLQDQAKRAREAVKAEKARQKIKQGQTQLMKVN